MVLCEELCLYIPKFKKQYIEPDLHGERIRIEHDLQVLCCCCVRRNANGVESGPNGLQTQGRTHGTTTGFGASLIGLAGALAVGLLLNILACALYKTALPILAAVAYFFAPFPNLLCGRSDGYSEVPKQRKDWGYFLTGLFVITGFGIPAILAHSDIIKLPAFLMALSGGLIVYGTLIVYIHFFHTKKDDDF